MAQVGPRKRKKTGPGSNLAQDKKNPRPRRAVKFFYLRSRALFEYCILWKRSVQSFLLRYVPHQLYHSFQSTLCAQILSLLSFASVSLNTVRRIQPAVATRELVLHCTCVLSTLHQGQSSNLGRKKNMQIWIFLFPNGPSWPKKNKKSTEAPQLPKRKQKILRGLPNTTLGPRVARVQQISMVICGIPMLGNLGSLRLAWMKSFVHCLGFHIFLC